MCVVFDTCVLFQRAEHVAEWWFKLTRSGVPSICLFVPLVSGGRSPALAPSLVVCMRENIRLFVRMHK